MIIPGGLEASPPPEFGGFTIDGIDQQGPSPDQRGRLNAALERVLHKACANTQTYPCGVSGELAEQHAGNRVRRLSCPDRTRQDRWHNGGGREAIVAHYTLGLMHHENSGEPLLLIGKGPRLQPVVERGVATGELGYIVSSRKWFGA